MLFGNYYIYPCPGCNNKIYRGSLMSGNTFDAEYFSDGKRIAPMLTDFPQITKCDHCHTIFWLNHEENIGMYEPFGLREEKQPKMQEARFLTIPEYFEALNPVYKHSADEERFIRIQIWQAFNDHVRPSRERKNRHQSATFFTSEEEKGLWKQNAFFLEEMLDNDELNDRILLAELNRNAGKFDRCMQIINNIDDKEIDWLKKLFEARCLEKDPNVFLLNPEE